MTQNRGCSRPASRGVLLRAVIGAGFAAVIACSYAPAARAGDDDDESFTTKFMKTLGLKDPRDVDYGISYSERSPLVVPPTRDLPAPVATGVPPAPNWPKDPDVRKRAIAKEKKKEIHPANTFADSLPLRPDELDKGRGSNADEGKMATPGGSGESGPSSPYDLNGKKSVWDPRGWFKKEEYATFTGEPSRASLTDPPAGYQTPSPDQPYGIGTKGNKTKAKGLGERMEDTGGH